MGKSTKGLHNSERWAAPTGLFGTSEKKRDQQAALRANESLSQAASTNDLLRDLVVQQQETNRMLRWMCDLMHEESQQEGPQRR